MGKEKVKVIEFIQGLYMGGAETLVKDYCLHFDKENFDVTLLCLRRLNSPYEDLLMANGIKIIFLDDEIKINKIPLIMRRLVSIIRRIFFLRNYIRKEKPDILHTHLLPLNTYVYFAGLSRMTHVFSTLHNDPEKGIWNFEKRIGNLGDKLDFFVTKRMVGRKKLRLIVLHEEMRKKVNEMFCIDNSVIINNGIDFRKFDIHISREDIRKKLGIPQNAFVVGHIGRFVIAKNHSFLVKVFGEIVKRNQDAFLLLIGNGELKEDIEKEIKELNLEKKVKMLSNRSDIPELLSIMDIFVFPSIYEGLPVALIEAQKAKVKCVVSNLITSGVKVSNLIRFMSLEQSEEEWAEEILNFQLEQVEYYKIEEWDITAVVKKLQELFKQEIMMH